MTNDSMITPEQGAAEVTSPTSAAPCPPKGEVLKTARRTQEGTKVFEYTDYRLFLRDFYELKKITNPGYSMSNFVRRAGLGANSRGYLKLVIEGKRNLTANTIRRFSEALGLSVVEAIYFENLVFFNQAKSGKDRDYYFQRLTATAEGHESQQLEVMKAKYSYWANWYLVVIRELVGLPSFKEESGWIAEQLRGKVSRRQVTEALQILERLELVRRDPGTGRLVQSEPLIKHTGDFYHDTIMKYHLQMMDRAKEALQEDDFDNRSLSSVTLACNHAKMPAIRKLIAEFRDQLNVKFGAATTDADAVFQVNFQLFQFTPVRNRKNSQQTRRESHEGK